MTTSQPIDARALAAAERIAAAGGKVTARAVRHAAKVSMATASQAAHQWNTNHAGADTVPAIPDTVQTRLDGIWADAYNLAAATWSTTRAGLEQQLRDTETERDALIDDISTIEAALESVTTERDQAVTKTEQLIARAVKAEAEAALLAQQITEQRQHYEQNLAAERDTITILREQLTTSTNPTNHNQQH